MEQIKKFLTKRGRSDWLLCVALALIVAGCSSSGGTEETPESTLPPQEFEDIALDPELLAQSATVFDPSITDGETLFISYCAKCHGKSGLGDGPSVGSLSTQDGMNLTILQERSDEELYATITGGKGVEMPPWGIVLTDEQREILVTYVRSLGEG